MIHKKGDRIGGTCLYTDEVYVGTVYKVESVIHWINVDGGGTMMLDADYDNIKPVCKSSNIVYARSDH